MLLLGPVWGSCWLYLRFTLQGLPILNSDCDFCNSQSVPLLTAHCPLLFDLFERRRRRALFPRGELREAVRQRIEIIARALASPA